MLERWAGAVWCITKAMYTVWCITKAIRTPSTVGELSNCDTVRCNTWEGRLISILMNMLKLNLFFCEGCFEISSENKILSMDYLKPHHRAAVFHLQLLVQACTIVYNWVLERTSCHQGPERPPGLWGLIPGWGHQCTLPGTPGTLPMHTTRNTRHTTRIQHDSIEINSIYKMQYNADIVYCDCDGIHYNYNGSCWDILRYPAQYPVVGG